VCSDEAHPLQYLARFTKARIFKEGCAPTRTGQLNRVALKREERRVKVVISDLEANRWRYNSALRKKLRIRVARRCLV
jgi:hypothetical protein